MFVQQDIRFRDKYSNSAIVNTSLHNIEQTYTIVQVDLNLEYFAKLCHTVCVAIKSCF